MQETAKDVAIDSAAGWDETTLAIFRQIDGAVNVEGHETLPDGRYRLAVVTFETEEAAINFRSTLDNLDVN